MKRHLVAGQVVLAVVLTVGVFFLCFCFCFSSSEASAQVWPAVDAAFWPRAMETTVATHDDISFRIEEEAASLIASAPAGYFGNEDQAVEAAATSSEKPAPAKTKLWFPAALGILFIAGAGITATGCYLNRPRRNAPPLVFS